MWSRADNPAILPAMSTIVSSASGLSQLEWQLQGFLTALNALPVLLFAVAVAVFGFFAGIFWPILGWIVFGILAALIGSYAMFCLAAGRALSHRRDWGILAAVVIYVVYLVIYFWASSVPAHPAELGKSNGSLQNHYPPSWLSAMFPAALHVLTLLNAIGLVHIVVRWVRSRFAAIIN